MVFSEKAATCEQCANTCPYLHCGCMPEQVGQGSCSQLPDVQSPVVSESGRLLKEAGNVGCQQLHQMSDNYTHGSEHMLKDLRLCLCTCQNQEDLIRFAKKTMHFLDLILLSSRNRLTSRTLHEIRRV